MQAWISFEDYGCVGRDVSRVKDGSSSIEIDLPEAEIARMEKIIADFWELQRELETIVAGKKAP